MARLRFPSLESLRSAVAAGIVPCDAEAGPQYGAVDGHGAAWLDAGRTWSAPSLLTRLGVTHHPPGREPELRPLTHVLELAALTPTVVVPPRVRLIVLDRAAAALHALLERLGLTAEVRLSGQPGRTWFTAADLPTYLTDRAADLGGQAYGELRPGCWVAVGWTHPWAAHLPSPVAADWLMAPDRPWVVVPHERPAPLTIQPARSHAGRLMAATPEADPPTDAIPIRITLKSSYRSVPATLWRLPGRAECELRELAETIDDRRLKRVLTATFSDAAGESSWVRVETSRGKAMPVLTWPGGYAAHPQIAGLFVPVGKELTPRLRPRVASHLFGVGIGRIAVVEDHGPEQPWTLHHLATGDFRRLAPRCEFAFPPPRPHAADRDAFTNRFALPAFTVDAENAPVSSKVVAGPKAAPAISPVSPAVPPTPWWNGVAEWTGRNLARFQRRTGTRRSTKPAEVPPIPAPAPDRVRDQLASRHALLLGHEWNARRLELEQRIVTEMPVLDGPARAALWSFVAAVYGSVGQNGEAALCRLNAVWEGDPPDANAATTWWRAELRAARLGENPREWSAQSGPATARAAAAYLCQAAASVHAPNEAIEERRGLLQLVHRWEAELPVRAVWLAETAAAKLAGGDPLALAHGRDRLLVRLNELGPSLDLDAPGFLRFRRGPSGDRFQTARDWLVRIREPMHRWLAELQGHGRLQWAGLDPEATATLAYADLIRAWGFGKLGDRLRAKELEQEARTVLTAIRGPGIVPAVHAVLADRFAARIRSGTDLRSPEPRPPFPEAEGDELARYAVARLQTGLGVLTPIPFQSAYAGRDVVGFLGRDELGERLRHFLSVPGHAAQTPWEARRLLAVDEADPTALTMPRILFALLERADELDAHLIAAVIPQTMRAVLLIPDWVQLGLPDRDATATTLRYGRRMLVHAARAAELLHLAGSFRDLAEQLIEQCADRAGLTARLALSCSAELMHALLRLGLTAQAGVLATRLNGPGSIAPAKLGLTGGLYAAGDEDGAGRLLDAARTKLLVRRIADDSDRTDMALAYAAALATAPHGIALGRLEELFQRLEMIGTTGAANRYYTLQPLRLIDVVVRAVLGDDFTLGPAARTWLDDDEFLIRRRIARDFTAAITDAEPRRSGET